MAKEVRWLRVSVQWSFFQQANVNGAGTGVSDHEDWCRFLGRNMCVAAFPTSGQEGVCDDCFAWVG